MPTIRVAIVGATGYTGEELIRLLLHHPSVTLTYLAASAKWERPVPVSEVFPRFARQLDLPIESLDQARLDSLSDVVFLATPHGTSMRLGPHLLKGGKRVIDLSGDFRLQDPAQYPHWYMFEHAHPEWLRDQRIAYGLSEYYRPEIARARLVANPGCYATSVLLGCLPLFKAKLVTQARLIVDAKSGLSGAGRKADESLLFSEMTENLRAYKVNHHQHMPEILQAIRQLTGHAAQMVFVPQVIPVSRGLLSAIYVQTTAAFETIAKMYQDQYAMERTPFVRVRIDRLPQLRDVTGTNYCDIGLTYDRPTECLLVMSALDNLIKGAAGQAIQNFNLMHGFPEIMGLV